MNSLSSRERILKVINHEIPDKVPVSLFFGSLPSFITILYPKLLRYGNLYKHPEGELEYCTKIVEFSRKMGVDLIIRPNWHRPSAIQMGVTSDSARNWHVSVTSSSDGKHTTEIMGIQTPKGELRQVKRRSWLTKEFYTESNIECVIKNEKDLDLLIEYEPKPDNFTYERIASHLIPLKKLVGEEGVFIPWIGCGPFNTASYLRRLEDLLIDPYTNPDFYCKFLDYCAQRNLSYALLACAVEPDMLTIGGNVAGANLVSKKYFDNFVLPYEKLYIQGIQATGVPVLYHNCGYSMTLLESYADMGLAAIESFSPPPLGDGDISEAKRRIGNRVILMGGIDHKNLLEKGTVDEVRKVTRKVVEAGKPGGMFILSQADYLEENCKLENIEAMIETALMYGMY